MKFLVNAVVIMGLTWVGAQAFADTASSTQTTKTTVTKTTSASPKVKSKKITTGVYRPPLRDNRAGLDPGPEHKIGVPYGRQIQNKIKASKAE